MDNTVKEATVGMIRVVLTDIDGVVRRWPAKTRLP